MKRDPKTKKPRLTFSSEKLRDLKKLPDDQLANVVGGMMQPCGMSYKGWD
ncbi:MAG: hypothetical protein ACM31C_19755 [Acidobacteriota bacterium]